MTGNHQTLISWCAAHVKYFILPVAVQPDVTEHADGETEAYVHIIMLYLSYCKWKSLHVTLQDVMSILEISLFTQLISWYKLKYIPLMYALLAISV